MVSEVGSQFSCTSLWCQKWDLTSLCNGVRSGISLLLCRIIVSEVGLHNEVRIRISLFLPYIYICVCQKWDITFLTLHYGVGSGISLFLHYTMVSEVGSHFSCTTLWCRKWDLTFLALHYTTFPAPHNGVRILISLSCPIYT